MVTKQTAGVFTKTDRETHLRSRGATQLVLAGVAASMGLESTAHQAHELGVNVALAIDAMTDLYVDVDVNSVSPRLGETGTIAEILELLKTRDA